MDDVEIALRRQVALGPRQAPVNPSDAAELAADSRRARLLVALTDDEAVHAEWARSTEYADLDRYGKAAWLRADLEEVDETIDRLLEEGDHESLELLARCDIGWSHDAIADAVDREETRAAAAMVLARSTPGRLRSSLMNAEEIDRVAEMLRAGAVVGADELWDQFLIWHGRLEEVDAEIPDGARAALEGAGAALDPTLFGRGLLAGDYDTAWLDDSRAVGDLLQVYGPSDWLEVAATLEFAGADGFELAATLAVSAALGIGDERPNDDEIERLVDLLAEEPRPNQKESPWESAAAKLGYGFQVALGGESFGLLLAQAAAHERLVTHGVHSPGIRGLPLSATGLEHVDADATRSVVETIAGADGESEQMLVAAVRTLYDAGVWARRPTDEIDGLVEAVADAFETSSRESIELARAHLLAELDPAHERWEHRQFDEQAALPEAMVLSGRAPGEDVGRVVDELAGRAAADESTLALDCIRRIGNIERPVALERLGELWLGGAPVLRAPFVRGVLEESIAVSVEDDGERAGI